MSRSTKLRLLADLAPFLILLGWLIVRLVILLIQQVLLIVVIDQWHVWSLMTALGLGIRLYALEGGCHLQRRRVSLAAVVVLEHVLHVLLYLHLAHFLLVALVRYVQSVFIGGPVEHCWLVVPNWRCKFLHRLDSALLFFLLQYSWSLLVLKDLHLLSLIKVPLPLQWLLHLPSQVSFLLNHFHLLLLMLSVLL